MVLSLRFGAVSDIGRSRKKNDDSGYAGGNFVMVADGMGGAPAGDIASTIAVQTMRRLDETPPEDMLEALAGAIHRANDRLAEVIDEDPAVDGLGTTVTAALFDGERIGVAHLGDSRGYLWRDGELLRITHDHTWVQSLIDEGRITEEEAAVHSHRSLLLKVLDGRHDNDPDLTLYDVQPGDRILLCSDGLSGFVSYDRIERVMSIGTAESVAKELTQLALEAGSTDNITVVVGDVVEEDAVDAPPLVVGAAGDHPRGPFGRLREWAQRDDADTGEILLDDPDVDPEELRYAPREPRPYLWLRRAALLLLVLALLAVGLKLSYGWTQKQYYVAAHDGQVAIYQGVQANLPGIDLHHVYEAQDLALDELPEFRRSQVFDGMTADDLGDARRIVAQLQTFANECARQAASEQASTATTTPRETGTTGQTGQTDRSTRTPDRTDATPRKSEPPRNPSGTRDTSPSRGGKSSTPATTADTSTTSTDTSSGGSEECSGSTPQTGTSR